MTGRSRVRDPWLDNVRLLAVVGVVVGHCLTAMTAAAPTADWLWTATWAFRVPVLVVIAGWFSSSAPLTRSRSVHLLMTVGLTFLVVDLAGGATRWLTTGRADLDPLVPGFGVWFLFSLLLWRAALPFLDRVPFLLGWSVLAAVLVGLLPADPQLSALVRTVAWFPLFVLGHRLRGTELRAALVASRWTRPVAACVAVGAVAAGLLVSARAGSSALPMVDGFTAGSGGTAVQAAVRVGVLALGAAGALAVLALMPRRRIPVVTYLGTGAMFIYVLHTLLVPPLRTWGAFDWVTSPLEVLLAIAAVVASALLLGTPAVRRSTVHLVRPYVVAERWRASWAGRRPGLGDRVVYAGRVRFGLLLSRRVEGL